MATHDTNISLLNTTLGIPQGSDGIVEFICKGVATSNLPLNHSVLLAKLADAVSLGITAAYDVTNNTAVYQQISEFYKDAGDGTLCWLALIDKTVAMATSIALSTTSQLIQATATADPTQRAKIVAFCFERITPATATDFPTEVTAAITAAQTLQQNLFKNGFRIVTVIDGAGMNKTTTSSSLATVANDAAPQVGLVITTEQVPFTTAIDTAGTGYAIANGLGVTGGTGTGMTVNITSVSSGAVTGYSIQNYGLGYSLNDVITIVQTGGSGGSIEVNAVNHNSSVGHLLARESQITVGTSPGRVSDGPINASSMFLTNGLNINDLSKSDFDSLGGKQYIFALTLNDYSGYYWNDDSTCDLATHALSRIKENRVANKLCDAANAMMVADREANLIVTNDGNLDAGYCATKSKYFYTTYIQPLVITNDISNASLTISGANYSTTKQVNLSLKIIAATPYGNVAGTVEFVATL